MVYSVAYYMAYYMVQYMAHYMHLQPYDFAGPIRTPEFPDFNLINVHHVEKANGSPEKLQRRDT
jgi:hypothetical protein